MINIYSIKDFILEKRTKSDRENLTTYNQLINFLKKHNYNFSDDNKETGGGGGSIFVSLKDGNYVNLIPPRNTAYIYHSPQGFYCFDFKVAKKFLFNGKEIKPENFDIEHSEIGLGINNNVPTGDWVRDPNRMFQDMPRYLYVLKTKKDAAILNNSQNDSVADYFFVRFVNWYSNHFQKNSIMTVFDPKKKIDLKLSNIQNVKDYFEKK